MLEGWMREWPEADRVSERWESLTCCDGGPTTSRPGSSATTTTCSKGGADSVLQPRLDEDRVVFHFLRHGGEGVPHDHREPGIPVEYDAIDELGDRHPVLAYRCPTCGGRAYYPPGGSKRCPNPGCPAAPDGLMDPVTEIEEGG
jgi:hypothetical protein